MKIYSGKSPPCHSVQQKSVVIAMTSIMDNSIMTVRPYEATCSAFLAECCNLHR